VSHFDYYHATSQLRFSCQSASKQLFLDLALFFVILLNFDFMGVAMKMSFRSRSCFRINCLPCVVTILLGLVFLQASALVIPPSDSDFYYQVGGGNDVPLPAFYDKTYVPLKVEANVGLGMNCGAFNPALSLSNSLNTNFHAKNPYRINIA
jgi:hypothetical protein